MAIQLSVIIPAYNERAHVREILQRVQNARFEKEVVVVDDYSTDGTRQWLEELTAQQARGTREIAAEPGDSPLRIDNLRIFFQSVNQGKGAALRRGFAEARGEVVLVQDADLEYDPGDYPLLVGPILEGRADVVYGSRYLTNARPKQAILPYVANRFLTFLSNSLTHLKLTDMETCYKAFRRDVIQGIRLEANRFDFEPEITAKIARGKWRVLEVPIHYAARSHAQGKKISWRDGAHAVWCILRYNLFG
jgi:glycosyltransferase involved in cell wall biosynthesis